MRFFLCVIILLMWKLCLGKEGRNPFSPLLPKPKGVILKKEKEEEKEKLKELDVEDIKLEGIIWGKDKACAIINGKVYKKGERIEEIDAKILDIDKESVSLKYGEKIYKVSIESELGKEKE